MASSFVLNDMADDSSGEIPTLSSTTITAARTSKARPLSDFIAQVRKRGIARQENYVCEISVPSFLLSASPDIPLITMFVEAAQFPEMMLAVSQIKDNGLTRDVVYDKSYGSFTATFMCDQQMVIKSFFDTWISAVVRRKGGVFMYPDSYTANSINMIQLDSMKSETYLISMNRVYPKTVSEIMVSAGARDFSRFQVQFAYESWDSSRISTSALSDVGRTGPGTDFARIINLAGGISTQGIKSSILVTAQQAVIKLLNGSEFSIGDFTGF